MEKICGFYASDLHLVTMILPYLREELKKEINIETFFEKDLTKDINKILHNLIIHEENKREILKINWRSNKIKKYSNIEKVLKEKLEQENENIILVGGNKKYVKEINNMLDKFFEKNNKKNVKIINCYEVTLFDDNISDILNEHRFILNTSGINKIEDVFEGYKKQIAT